MQDRFKFRIWDKEQNKYFSFEDFKRFDVEFNFDPTTNEVLCEYNDARYVVLQCTGIKDTNDKLIYEKDIIKCFYGNVGALGVVEWDFENMQFVLKIKEDFYSFSPKTIYEKIKILGNIYETPELLEVNSET